MEIDQLIEDLIRRKKESEEVLSQPLNINKNLTDTNTPNAQPTTVDYRSKMLQVLNQGDEGSSVGFAVAACVEFQIIKHLGKKIKISPRYIYNYTRKTQKLLHIDAGTNVQKAIEVVKQQGAVTEKDWPYKAGEYNVDILKQLETVDHYQIEQAYKVKNVDKIMTAINAHGPVVIGITVYQSFMDDSISQSGIIPMPKNKDNIVGGHAICLVGFDVKEKHFIFRNSWGAKWGQKGYGQLPFEYIEQYSDDGWAFNGVHIKQHS
jgi:C1A family cysteine protease